MLVITDLPEESQFLVLDPEWLEAARYASLWATRDVRRVHNIKIFWVLMDVTLCQWINKLPRLTDEIYESMKQIAEFKADMRHVCIRAQKDSAQAWTSLWFIAINDVIDGIVDT